jgi:hypothetical protein
MTQIPLKVISMETVTLYRPTGPNELALVAESNFKRWPPRLPEQPVFYPVTNEEYASEIAVKWNTKNGGVGYVTRFKVKKEFMDQYGIHQVGASHHTECWIPADELEALNDNIVGSIEVIGEYREEG